MLEIRFLDTNNDAGNEVSIEEVAGELQIKVTADVTNQLKF